MSFAKGIDQKESSEIAEKLRQCNSHSHYLSIVQGAGGNTSPTLAMAKALLSDAEKEQLIQWMKPPESPILMDVSSQKTKLLYAVDAKEKFNQLYRQYGKEQIEGLWSTLTPEQSQILNAAITDGKPNYYAWADKLMLSNCKEQLTSVREDFYSRYGEEEFRFLWSKCLTREDRTHLKEISAKSQAELDAEMGKVSPQIKPGIRVVYVTKGKRGVVLTEPVGKDEKTLKCQVQWDGSKSKSYVKVSSLTAIDAAEPAAEGGSTTGSVANDSLATDDCLSTDSTTDDSLSGIQSEKGVAMFSAGGEQDDGDKSSDSFPEVSGFTIGSTQDFVTTAEGDRVQGTIIGQREAPRPVQFSSGEDNVVSMPKRKVIETKAPTLNDSKPGVIQARMSLNEIVEAIRTTDNDEEEVQALLERLEGKVDDIAAVRDELLMDLEAHKARLAKAIEIYETPVKRCETALNRVAGYLKYLHQKGTLATVSEGGNRKIVFRRTEKVEVMIPPEKMKELYPDRDFTKEKVTITISKTALKEALKSGEEVEGAYLQENYNPTFYWKAR